MQKSLLKGTLVISFPTAAVGHYPHVEYEGGLWQRVDQATSREGRDGIWWSFSPRAQVLQYDYVLDWAGHQGSAKMLVCMLDLFYYPLAVTNIEDPLPSLPWLSEEQHKNSKVQKGLPRISWCEWSFLPLSRAKPRLSPPPLCVALMVGQSG